VVADDARAPVAVRAELDGLPIEERTGATFTAHGAVMHACGHDVHMAALVALTRAAHELEEALPAPLLAIFQPSEEAYPSGALQLLRSGELAAFAPAAIVAAHVHPELPWGAVGLDIGAVNASCDAIEITVEGEPTHSAYPHRGRDPILAVAQIVVALHAEFGRRIDPLHAASLTVGVLEGGSAENVIPGRAVARGALRAHRAEDRQALRELVEQVTAGVASAHGCRSSVKLVPGEPALENDALIVTRARELLPAAGLTAADTWRSCGSDDFAFFSALAPLAMAFVGLDGADGFPARPLHHPELLPPDAAVGAVARAQAVLYLAAAQSSTDQTSSERSSIPSP
jgi:amidohydrolase